MVVTIHDELEGGVWDVFLPQVPRGSISFVHLFVRMPFSVQLIHRSCHENHMVGTDAISFAL
jgi:hypothetical protein